MTTDSVQSSTCQYSVFGDLNGQKPSQCCHCDRKQQRFELEIQMIAFELTGEFSDLQHTTSLVCLRS